MSEKNVKETTGDPWIDDVLDRRKYAKFLTQLVRSRCAPLNDGDSSRPFALALDADWGGGKSFFVQRWSQDLAQECAVVLFDAWKSDATAEPLVALISEINKQLEPLVGKLPAAGKVRQTAQDGWQSAKKAARKIALPAAKIAANTVLKHLAGMSLADVAGNDEVDDSSSDDTPSHDTPNDSDVINKLAEKVGLELEKEYESRQRSVAVFKEKLNSIVAALNEHKLANGPLVVFVDELDRCRPDFAIKLLETVKHIFDVSNVCFVVSVNIQQMSQSIRAVYGANFDGWHYLHRFFDLTYQLPEPEHYRYATSLFAKWPMRLTNLSYSRFVYSESRNEDPTAYLFSAVAREFGLDLRAQIRTFETALSATDANEPNTALHPLFLFFLSAVYVRQRSGWKAFWTKHAEANGFYNWYAAHVRQPTSSVDLFDSECGFSTEPEGLGLYSLINEYRNTALMSGSEIAAKLNGFEAGATRNFPNSLFGVIVNGRRDSNGRAYVSRYKKFVELAGHIA